jgi:hypothetical protein
VTACVRLAEVIDAGTNGMLGEDLFAHCLKVNDAVIRTLDAERVRYFALCVCMYV